MSVDEHIHEINCAVSEALNQGVPFCWACVEKGVIVVSYDEVNYLHPGFIARFHMDAVPGCLTWRQEQKIRTRLILLSKRGLLSLKSNERITDNETS